MDSYEFYKSIFDRELNRRKDLDASISLPLTLLTIIVASNSYIAKQTNFKLNNCNDIVGKVLFLLIFGVVLVTIFFLMRSFNNFFKGFAYRNLGLTSEIRKYEIEDVPRYNLLVKSEDDIINFEKKIIEKLTESTDNHIIINDKRSYDLYLSKTSSIIGIILTTINFLLIIIKSGTI